MCCSLYAVGSAMQCLGQHVVKIRYVRAWLQLEVGFA